MTVSVITSYASGALGDTAIALFRSWLIERFGLLLKRPRASVHLAAYQTSNIMKSACQSRVIGGGVVGASVFV